MKVRVIRRFFSGEGLESVYAVQWCPNGEWEDYMLGIGDDPNGIYDCGFHGPAVFKHRGDAIRFAKEGNLEKCIETVFECGQ